MHRFLWDLHYAPIPGMPPEYPIAAVPHDTAPAPSSPWVMPGRYTVKLTVSGKTYSQPITVVMDPRVKTPAAALQQQFTTSKQLYDAALQLTPAMDKARAWREQLAHADGQGSASSAISDFEKKLDELVGGGRGGRRFFAGAGEQRGPESLNAVRGGLLMLLYEIQSADAAPTQAVAAAASERMKTVAPALERWQQFQKTEVPAINQQLKSAGLPELQ